MAEYTKITTIEVGAQSYAVSVSDRGSFVAHLSSADPRMYENRLATATTYDELQKRLKEAVRKKRARVQIPFVELDRRTLELRSGIARGIHMKDREILVTWSDGEKAQLSRHSHDFLRPLTPEEAEEIVRLAQNVRVARAALAEAEKPLSAAMLKVELGHQYGRAKELQLPSLGDQVEKAIQALVDAEAVVENAKPVTVTTA